jgi:hypothetical protein
MYPSAPEIPRNILRMYLHFSAPMTEGLAAACVQVRRVDTGEPVTGAFLEMEPELWDTARRRLTLLFDPARIKRGLLAHREIGYPLTTGVAVEVTVDERFLDAEGRPLASAGSRRYEVGSDERTRPEPARWQLDPPRAGSTDPLVIRFERPLDHGLLQRCIAIGRDGTRLAGAGASGDGERSWRFRPARSWDPMRHAVVVDPILEDVAGNSLRRVFDRDLSNPDDTPGPPNSSHRFFVPT